MCRVMINLAQLIITTNLLNNLLYYITIDTYECLNTEIVAIFLGD